MTRLVIVVAAVLCQAGSARHPQRRPIFDHSGAQVGRHPGSDDGPDKGRSAWPITLLAALVLWRRWR